jgi:D-hexose-6-phosphate mutarotase
MATTTKMMMIEVTNVQNNDTKPLRQYFAQYASRIPFFFDTRLRYWVMSADVSIEHGAFIFKVQEVRREYFSHYQFFLDLQVRTTDKLISILIYIQQDATLHNLFYLQTALHVSDGSTIHHQELQQLYLPDAADTAVGVPDDGWWHHPKHVEQFSDKINCVTFHLVGYILEYSYDARTHKC